MSNFYSKFRYTPEDILHFIENTVEESVKLQYRPGDFLQKTKEREHEVARDISAFANSDGGLIIYGIKAKDHKAEGLSFLDSREFTDEWLENLAISLIDRRIEGLRTCMVCFDDDPAKCVIVLRVPASYRAPHQAPDKRFYRRYNNESVPMEGYEIRNLMNRQEKTHLVIEDILVSTSHIGGAGEKLRFSNFMLKFQISNVSNSIELIYKTVIAVPKLAYVKASHTNPLQPYFMRNEGDLAYFSIPNKYPLFQDELTTVASGLIRVDPETLESFSNPGVTVKLYYSNGVDERTFDLSKDLQYKGKILGLEDFEKEREIEKDAST